MSWWSRPKDIQQYEDKRYLEEHLKKMQNRHDNSNESAKEGIKYMVWGLISAGILTFFDYGLRHFELSGALWIAFRLGMILSAITTLLFPYGLYKFIKGFGVKKKK